MVRKIFCFFIGHALIYQVFTANLHNLHPALQQYILGGLPQPSHYPSVTVTKQNNQYNLQSLAALASLLGAQSVQPLPVKTQAVSPTPTSLLAALTSELPSYSTSSPNLSSLAALTALLGLQSPPKTQSVQTPSNVLTSLTSEPAHAALGGIDASLLNNLAIALQLLLVSNMINSPQQEASAESIPPGYQDPVAPITAQYQSNQPQPATGAPMQPKSNYMQSYEQPAVNSNYNTYESSAYSAAMPNADFMGSSNFASSNPFGGTIPPPSSSSSRAGFSLMSPYEALNPSSPYSDPILASPFGSIMTSKKDFQSPYSTIMAADNKDLFSFSDFF